MRGAAAPEPAGSPFAVRVTVASGGAGHPISPYIYGASAVAPETARAFGVSTVRWGGNRTSRYNWKAQADNAGSDWFFLNGKAGRWSDFLAGNRKAGLASYLTVPMLPWVAKGADGSGFSVARYGPQQKVEPYVADRGNGLKPDGSPVVGNDPRDTSVPSDPAFQAAGIKALPKTADGPPVVYGLDNEPMLWHVDPPRRSPRAGRLMTKSSTEAVRWRSPSSRPTRAAWWPVPAPGAGPT